MFSVAFFSSFASRPPSICFRRCKLEFWKERRGRKQLSKLPQHLLVPLTTFRQGSTYIDMAAQTLSSKAGPVSIVYELDGKLVGCEILIPFLPLLQIIMPSSLTTAIAPDSTKRIRGEPSYTSECYCLCA